MLIHVVQQGDTIESIAAYYGVPADKLAQDNGLSNPAQLAIGLCIVITFPEQVYVVQEGDTLESIAKANHVTVMQLLMNNPFLSTRNNIYPGETLVISYHRKGKITTHGNTVPYINLDTLRKTLPYLTYLSILNYTATKEGNITSYYDEADVIQTAKEYGVMPLMILTTLTIQGIANISTTYDILLSEDFQNKQIENILNILETKGYYGVNLSFENVNAENLHLYEGYFTRVSEQLTQRGYMVFVTVNTNITGAGTEVSFERINYAILNQFSSNIIFMDYEWAININPPSPISSIHNIDAFLDYVNNYFSSEKEIIGMATIGYDWELPFSAGLTSVYSLTLERAVDLAYITDSVIQFDEISQTPFYTYVIERSGSNITHIVWFIDARSINALLDLVIKYQLRGIGIWNITVYNPQLWLVINSQYEIEKVI
jgi:spore germination protein